MVQNPSSHCRDSTGRKVHADEIMHDPVHISPFLQSSCLLRIHIGTSAIGRTAPSQRRMEGFQMIGMHIGNGHRLGRVGMLWIGRLIPGSFATALMLLRPFVLQPPFDTFGERLLWASSFAGAPGLTTQCKHETPIPPLPIGQQGQIACWLDDLTQETHGFFQHLPFFPSTGHVPQKAGRSIHQDDCPSLGRIWSHILVHACIQLITFNHLQ